MDSIVQHAPIPSNVRQLQDKASPPYDGQRERRKHVTVIGDGVVEAVARLGTNALGLYVLLERRANAEGCCWPSYQTLAEEGNVSRRHVIDATKRLVAAGFVQVRKRSGPHGGPASNEFFLPHHITPEITSDLRGEPSERPSASGALASERPSEPSRARTIRGSSSEVGDSPPIPPKRKRPTYPPRFASFKAQYPTGRGDTAAAYREWTALGAETDEPLALDIMAGLAKWCACEQWEEPRYVVAIERFLKRRDWESEPPGRSKPRAKSQKQSGMDLIMEYARGERS